MSRNDRKSGPNSAPQPDTILARPWSVRVARSDVPEIGRHFDLVADAQARTAIAKRAGVIDVSRLEASFDVTRHGRDGLRVVGEVSATVGQTCVVTLEPIEETIEEPVDLVFLPARAGEPTEEGEIEVPLEDEPEVLVDDGVDLGAIATEFVVLGVDPYPRKPGVVFETPVGDDDSAHPFAALAALKDKKAHGKG
jgi:uncharacterized metal-binding protein YceD (DUF177 family)